MGSTPATMAPSSPTPCSPDPLRPPERAVGSAEPPVRHEPATSADHLQDWPCRAASGRRREGPVARPPTPARPYQLQWDQESSDFAVDIAAICALAAATSSSFV